VTRIVTALKAHNPLRIVSQPIDDFAFTFITPLRTDYYNVPSHESFQFRRI
jgi:hypothetical protein